MVSFQEWLRAMAGNPAHGAKPAAANRRSASILVLCALAGAFAGSLLQWGGVTTPEHGGGIIAAVINFELNHTLLIDTLGTVWLLYWVVTRKMHRREAMILWGVFGFLLAQLALTTRGLLFH